MAAKRIPKVLQSIGDLSGVAQCGSEVVFSDLVKEGVCAFCEKSCATNWRYKMFEHAELLICDDCSTSCKFFLKDEK